jgi:hypothetical protein
MIYHIIMSLVCVLYGGVIAACEPCVMVRSEDAVKSGASVRVVIVPVRNDGETVRVIDVHEVMRCIEDNFNHTGLINCHVEHTYADRPHTQQDISRLAQQGYDFALFLQSTPDGSAIRTWIYDTAAVQMITGTRWGKRSNTQVWSDVIADDFWRRVMGGPSSFGTEIVYVKKERRGKRDQHDTLCTVPWTKGASVALCTRPTALIAPSWYIRSDGKQSILFSEVTLLSVRLMCCDRMSHTVRHIQLPHDDGMVVGVAQHPGEDSFVYCHSGSLWRFEKDTLRGKQIYRKYEDSDGPCVAPTVLRNGDVIYGVGGKIKRWVRATNSALVITAEGYCVAPSCHEDLGVIVYSRRVKGIMQLWVYDMIRQSHRQVSKGNGDKIDPSISPCGNFVAFCHEKNAKCSICVLNMITGEQYQVSPANDYAVYPAWSHANAL